MAARKKVEPKKAAAESAVDPVAVPAAPVAGITKEDLQLENDRLRDQVAKLQAATQKHVEREVRLDDDYCAKLVTTVLDRARVHGFDPADREVVFKRIDGERAVTVRRIG